MVEQRLSRFPQSPFVLLIAIVAAIGGLLFGYDTGAISGALLYISRDFALTPFEEEIVVSVLLLCAAISAIFAGRLTDRFGRKKMVIVAAALFFVGASAMAVAPHLYWLIFGRAFAGFAIGVASMTVPLYVSELSPPSVRGFCVTLNQLLVTVGILIAYGVDYGFSHTGNWHAMLGISAIPSAILFVLMFFLPETPRWLVMKGKVSLAKKVLSKISDSDVEGTVEKIHRQSEVQSVHFKELFSPRYKSALFAGVLLAIFQQVTGVNTVIYYAPTIFSLGGASSDTAAIVSTVGVGVVNVVFTVISLFLIDRVGRRPLLLIGTFLMALGLGSLGYGTQFVGHEEWVSWLVHISLFVYIAGFAIGLGPIAWLFIAEIYPLQARGKAMSCATTANWGINFLVAFTFLTLLQRIGASATFYLYAGICMVAWFYILAKIPETKDKTLEEIEFLFRRR
ncbi:sugar porter family MFS transporter [Simkania negevensis]|uniref:Sugar porter family MFS transporter n=1 Tax=Simkania negevensis TaxID=83561 RepID=A0ABS3AST0_9BACT|nr:sugar porter family MFS transporter [Simkania negevensis]